MDGVSIAASLVGLGTAGCQIAIKLYTLASQISTASQRISSVSNDISLTSGVLKELGEFMTRETATGGTSIFSQSGLETTKTSAAICESIFSEIEQAAKEASEQLRTRDRIVGKIKLSKSEKAKWPFLQPSIESLRIDLREAKGTLMLMLQVMNLAVSQRMAAIHQTTTTSIVEQREIYRAILAIQKQSQGNSSSRPKRSMGGSGEGTPRVVSPPSLASHTNSKKTSSRGDEMTSIAPSLAGLPNPQAFMAKPDPPVLRKSELEATNKNPSSGSIDTIDEAQRDGMNSNSNRLSPGGDKTPELTATVGNQGEHRKVLDYFVTKPIIKDDTRQPGAISLRFRNHKIPMQQVDIRKKLFCSKEEGLQSVLDAYLELCDHERLIIDNLTEDIGSHTSLMLLKRTYADISYRGILFKGIPELQFIMERVMKEDRDKGDVEAISEAASGATSEVRIVTRALPISEEIVHHHPTGWVDDGSDEIDFSPDSYHDRSLSRSRDRSRHTSLDRSHEGHRQQLNVTENMDWSSLLQRRLEKSAEPKRETVSRSSVWPKKLAKNKRKEDIFGPVDVLGEGKQSDDSDESSIMSDDAMNDEEAEKAVKELLEKYTILGAVVGEVSGSG